MSERHLAYGWMAPEACSLGMIVVDLRAITQLNGADVKQEARVDSKGSVIVSLRSFSFFKSAAGPTKACMTKQG